MKQNEPVYLSPETLYRIRLHSLLKFILAKLTPWM